MKIENLTKMYIMKTWSIYLPQKEIWRSKQIEFGEKINSDIDMNRLKTNLCV